MKRLLLFVFCTILFTISCDEDPQIDLDQISINTEVQRFDRAFYTLDTTHFEEGLNAIREKYAPFFSNEAEMIFWRNQRKDELQNKLFALTEQEFGDMTNWEQELNRLMKRYYYYFGTEDSLEVFTYISRLDFNYPIVVSKPYIFIALDLYLGKAAKEYYEILPQYLQYHRQSQFMLRDVAYALAEKRVPKPAEPVSLLDAMLYQGKLLKLTELLLGKVEEGTLMVYPPEKQKFCVEHEKEMWIYFIEQQMLFKSDEELKRRFMSVAPFSKFRTNIDAETPGRVGWWFGYRVLEAYLDEYPEQGLAEWLGEMDSRKILKLSSYKP